MKTTGTQNTSSIKTGFTLFEVLLALGVFGIAALSLVKTVQLMGEMAIEARTMREVQQGLESIIDEFGKTPILTELEQEVKAEAGAVKYHVSIRPVEGLRNKEGRELTGFFNITASAKWNNRGAPMNLEMTTMRFVNAFVPTQ